MWISKIIAMQMKTTRNWRLWSQKILPALVNITTLVLSKTSLNSDQKPSVLSSDRQRCVMLRVLTVITSVVTLLWLMAERDQRLGKVGLSAEKWGKWAVKRSSAPAKFRPAQTIALRALTKGLSRSASVKDCLMHLKRNHPVQGTTTQTSWIYKLKFGGVWWYRNLWAHQN